MRTLAQTRVARNEPRPTDASLARSAAVRAKNSYSRVTGDYPPWRTLRARGYPGCESAVVGRRESSRGSSPDSITAVDANERELKSRAPGR